MYYYYPFIPAPHAYPMHRNSRQINRGTNIPYVPIFGDQSQSEIRDHVYQSIVDEATAAEFYTRLLNETPDDLHHEFVEHARDDELEHLEALKKLYVYLTGNQTEYEIEPIQYDTYKDGILMALHGELEAAEFYRDVQLSTTDQVVKDTFFFAMVDELEHATQFGVLYSTL
ncbi:ferritin-like domain-containing protein [Bacillus shivajii]|uniref:ferritin-like domain-containing protein n=1 Tax=Bacillus shivajii TaxID=1983719 RepID=UPI001CFC3576|nr:ferritin-like domain-containing protein [Bacillus shivajii]UCZ54419.1 ferritin-like domain-containing protein [Bacillus shivajii]